MLNELQSFSCSENFEIYIVLCPAVVIIIGIDRFFDNYFLVYLTKF